MRNSLHLRFAKLLQCSKKSVQRPIALSKCFYSSENVSSKCKTGENTSRMSKHLYAKIKSCGPTSVADFMREALTHPTEGYYMKRDVFGSDGDFITSPEISQLFGEMIGIWVLSEWRKITRDEFQLVELGPGRGTLSKDILKVFRQLNVGDKLSIHLVEISPALSAIQAKNLCVASKEVALDSRFEKGKLIGHYREGVTEHGVKVFWYHSVEDIPRKFSVFIAHEFFDALPIHKFQRNNGNWSEIFVDVDPMSDDKFRYVVTKTPTLSSRALIPVDEKRDHVEVSPQTLVIVDYMSTFLKECGGFALIADYGHNGDRTDTFRAFKKHQQQDPLLNPGTADLTADVDFSMIKKTVSNGNRVIVLGPVNQRDFLMQLGIDVRLKMLLGKISEGEKKELESGYHMIVDEDKMGSCFKMMAMFPFVLKDHLTKWPVTGFFGKSSDER